jgi:hypothetical protein
MNESPEEEEEEQAEEDDEEAECTALLLGGGAKLAGAMSGGVNRKPPDVPFTALACGMRMTGEADAEPCDSEAEGEGARDGDGYATVGGAVRAEDTSAKESSVGDGVADASAMRAGATTCTTSGRCRITADECAGGWGAARVTCRGGVGAVTATVVCDGGARGGAVAAAVVTMVVVACGCASAPRTAPGAAGEGTRMIGEECGTPLEPLRRARLDPLAPLPSCAARLRWRCTRSASRCASRVLRASSDGASPSKSALAEAARPGAREQCSLLKDILSRGSVTAACMTTSCLVQLTRSAAGESARRTGCCERCRARYSCCCRLYSSSGVLLCFRGGGVPAAGVGLALPGWLGSERGAGCPWRAG